MEFLLFFQIVAIVAPLFLVPWILDVLQHWRLWRNICEKTNHFVYILIAISLYFIFGLAIYFILGVLLLIAAGHGLIF